MTNALTAGLVPSLLFGAAFLSAVFFQGFYTEHLCLTFVLLLLWGLGAAWKNYDAGFQLPRTIVVLSLTLYWVWLGVSGMWGRIAYLGTISFWWLGSLPLVFWIYTLSPSREQIWRHAFRWAVLVGVGLAITGCVQRLWYGLEPTAMFLNRNSLAALLTLTAIPLAGNFLLGATLPRWQRYGLGAAVFVLAFGVAVITGRGAIVCGGVGLVLLVGVAWSRVPKRLVVQLLAIVSLAFLIASQIDVLGLGDRMGTVVSSPWNAGATRFLIWEQSWEMLKQAPWMGVGLGHYAVYWPPYRNPADDSAGFFVHNDYLQIWIEAGLPGLLLLLSVLVCVLMTYLRAMRNAAAPAARKVEMTALFCGLLAIAAHSFVDFNLYVLSTLLLAGLVLGRLHALAIPERVATYTLAPAKYLSERGYQMVTALVMGLALLYFVTLGLASFEYKRGLALAEASKWDEAFTTLERAGRYYPYADNVTMSKADLLRQVMALSPESANEQKKNLFVEAEALFARAESLNPLRPQTLAAHALFYQQNPALVGADWSEKTLAYYRRALALDPRNYQARYLYADFLLKQGRQAEAHEILEAGIPFAHPAVETMVPYFALTAKQREAAGDREGAAVLRSQIRDIALMLRARSQQARPGTSP